MMQVLLADDRAIVHFAATYLLQQQFPGTTVSIAENTNEILTQLEQAKFDLLILDINLTAGTNLQLLEAVRKKQPDIRILILSGNIKSTDANRYVTAGANGLLLHSESERKLKDAIISIFKGIIYMSEGLNTYQ